MCDKRIKTAKIFLYINIFVIVWIGLQLLSFTKLGGELFEIAIDMTNPIIFIFAVPVRLAVILFDIVCTVLGSIWIINGAIRYKEIDALDIINLILALMSLGLHWLFLIMCSRWI